MAYSIELKQEVLEKIKQGESVKEISKEKGISVATIYNWKKQEKIQTEKSKEEDKKEKLLSQDDLYKETIDKDRRKRKRK